MVNLDPGGLGDCFPASPNRNGFVSNVLLNFAQNSKLGHGGLGACFSASPKRNGFVLIVLFKFAQNDQLETVGPWSSRVPGTSSF